MTPLQFCRTIVAELATLSTPEPRHALMGDVVVPCAGTYVAGLTQNEVDMGDNCAPIDTLDVVVIIARDCANVALVDGTTNWEAQDAVSAQMDLDGQLLWDWAEKARADAWYRTGVPTISYVILGAISMVTLSITLPIP